MHLPTPWSYPPDRYYYGWYTVPISTEPSDGDIKSRIVDRLRENPHTKNSTLKVDVKQRVVKGAMTLNPDPRM